MISNRIVEAKFINVPPFNVFCKNMAYSRGCSGTPLAFNKIVNFDAHGLLQISLSSDI